MKLYDFDGMFDEKLSRYVAKNVGKYTEAEWENVIPVLYKKFGETFIKSVGDTPKGFYEKMTDTQLVSSLSAHIKQQIPVSEFLCSALESRKAVKLLLPLLNGSEGEREYASSLLGAADEAIPVYMQILTRTDDENFKNKCADYIKEKADLVLDSALQNYKNGVEKELMLEIMSRSVIKREEIFNILIKEFRAEPENVALHASYLAAYGDERALKYLMDKIDEDGISFVEYQELKFAIESLGGEYEKERDFSNDEYYKLIKSGGGSTDVFGGLL